MAIIKQIRIHGRGGMGVVKAAEIIVYANVKAGFFGVSVPYFGFERQGAPVVAYVKLDQQPIRAKTQVDYPDCVVVMEPTLLKAVDVFEDLAKEGLFIINSKKCPDLALIPPQVKKISYVDATKISLDILGRPIPNTVMLGAFVQATKWVDRTLTKNRISAMFGAENEQAFNLGYEEVKTIEVGGRA